MPRFHSFSVEDIHTTTSSSFFSRRRSRSAALIVDATTKDEPLEETPRCTTDLTQPWAAAFPYPSPPASESSFEGTETPLVKACKAIDAYPFPRQGPKANKLSDNSNGFKRNSVSPSRRCFSGGASPRTPLSSPDRFIPKRLSPMSSTRSFHLSKPSYSLSGGEKLLRQRSASPDPFGPRAASRTRNTPTRLAPRRPSRTPRAASANGSGVLEVRAQSLGQSSRQASSGAVWNVGGTGAALNGPVAGVSDGRGGFLGSGTNAPMYTSQFLQGDSPDQDLDRHERRLAAAFDIDQASRVLGSPAGPKAFPSQSIGRGTKRKWNDGQGARTVWKDNEWVKDGALIRAIPRTPSYVITGYGLDCYERALIDSRRYCRPKVITQPRRAVPATPFRVLDAPQLRDDFYCSVLAFTPTSRTLAVGLNNKVYLWSEMFGVQYPPSFPGHSEAYVTSLSFSSSQGGYSILAIGRADGQVTLWSLFDEDSRFESQQPSPIACLAFKPNTTRRPSERLASVVDTEDLLVGDEAGNVHYYAIEWASPGQTAVHGWTGAMNLLARISVHTQQICGLAWSIEGDYFASGGNDNMCYLFEVTRVLGRPEPVTAHRSFQAFLAGFEVPGHHHNWRPYHTIAGLLGRRSHDAVSDDLANGDGGEVSRTMAIPGRGRVRDLTDGCQKHRWTHSAAVKAIAFCPWQRGLVATGGGSNDRAIHFYHCSSGACLATIDVAAQVTSLIWSTTRREIAATFGYAQPEHPFRIAVFTWPECQQVVAIPWTGDSRALYAIPYPGGPNEASQHRGEGGTWWSRTAEEGCIVVASSDESVKFHEVWSDAPKSTSGTKGLLGGSDILESLEGVDREGSEVIR